MLLTLTAAVGLPAVALGTSYDDTFSDGVAGPNWSVVQDNPELALAESGGHLNVVSAGGGVSTNDALYLSTFRMSTASDFAITLDYFLTPLNTYTGGSTSLSGDKLGVDFGVGRDAAGTDSAAIAVGYGNLVGFVADAGSIAYRNGNNQTTGNTELGSPTTGTFEIDYLTATDTLTLKRQGGFTYSLPAGTVKTVWGATELFVSFGGRGSGFTTTAGQLYVDNFTIVSGTVVPEPACLTLSVSALALLKRRNRTRPTAS